MKLQPAEIIPASAGNISDVETDKGYKYLRVLKIKENMQNKIKDEAKQTYIKRIKQVQKSKLNCGNKIQAINSYAIPVIGYTAGIISWKQNEIAELDRKTKKTLDIHGGPHQMADINLLNVPANKGGRGLTQIEYTILSEQMALQEYINSKCLNSTATQRSMAMQQVLCAGIGQIVLEE